MHGMINSFANELFKLNNLTGQDSLGLRAILARPLEMRDSENF